MANFKSLIKDTAIYGLSSIVGRFLNYLLVPLYTHKLAAASGGYGTITNIYAILLIVLQPQLYHTAIHAVIIGTSAHVAHFIALTNSKATNLMFFTIIAVILSLTVYNLWTFSSIF